MNEHGIVSFLRWLQTPPVTGMAIVAGVERGLLLVLAKLRWITTLTGWLLASGAVKRWLTACRKPAAMPRLP